MLKTSVVMCLFVRGPWAMTAEQETDSDQATQKRGHGGDILCVEYHNPRDSTAKSAQAERLGDDEYIVHQHYRRYFSSRGRGSSNWRYPLTFEYHDKTQ